LGFGPNDRNSPRRVVTVFDAHGDRVLESSRKSVRPFDGHHSSTAGHLVQAQIFNLARLQAIQIDVKERQAPTSILLNQRKRRTRDFSRIDAETLGHPFHECRFASAKIAG